MGQRTKPSIASGLGAASMAVWSGYSAMTGVADLPANATRFATFMADPPIYLPWIMLVACAAVLAWSLWPREEEPEEAPAASGPVTFQSSTGDSSPNFSGTFGPVILSPPAPPPTVAKERCPEWPMWRAIEYVSAVIGDQDETQCYPAAQNEIRQAAANGIIRVWGKKQKPIEHSDSPNACSPIFSPIPADYWHDYHLNSMATGEAWDNHPHTNAESHVATQIRSNRYWTLRVDRAEIESEWPGSAPRPPTRLVPDMPLNSVLVRVYQALGGTPDDARMKEKFAQRVDREVMDQIVLHNLAVWGRFGDRAIERLASHSLKKGRFDHKRARLKIPSIDSEMVYTDLKFIRSEIDEVWPE